MTEKMLMKKLMALDFMAIDLGLFLDTHPYDTEAIETYKCIVTESKHLKDKYEAQFGPICMKDGVNDGEWCWVKDPWPWQKEASCNLKGE